MTTKEQEAKIVNDLIATRRIIYESNVLLRRIEEASGKLLNDEKDRDD